MLDTTPLDVLCYDPVEGITYTTELTIAIDVASRSILAWRFKPFGTKAADAGTLIGDAMTPEPMRPGWPDRLRHAVLKLACRLRPSGRGFLRGSRGSARTSAGRRRCAGPCRSWSTSRSARRP
jgi:hypothetical protein